MEIEIHEEIKLAIERYYALCEYSLVSNATGQEVIPQHLIWAIVDKRSDKILTQGDRALLYGIFETAEKQEEEVQELFPEMIGNTTIVPYFLFSARELGMPDFGTTGT